MERIKYFSGKMDWYDFRRRLEESIHLIGGEFKRIDNVARITLGNSHHILERCIRFAKMMRLHIFAIIVLAAFGCVCGKWFSVRMISGIYRAGMILSRVLMEQWCQNNRNQIENQHRHSD